MKGCELRSTQSTIARTTLLMIASTGLAYALPNEAHLEATRQLVRLSSVENALRADTEQAASLVNDLPADLPMSLRSEIRNILDQRLAYSLLESRLIASAADLLDEATVESMLDWRTSAAGHALSQAESNAYASLYDQSSFGRYHYMPPRLAVVDSSLIDQVFASDHFLEFATQLSQGATSALSCIRTLLHSKPCAAESTLAGDSQNGPQPENLVDIAHDALSRVPQGNLHAYLDFLRADQMPKGELDLQSALVDVEHQAWRDTISQIEAALNRYSASLGGTAFEASLAKTTLQIDRGEDLASARFDLLQLQRAAPADPAVLVQLARVTLKLAPDTALYDMDPSVPHLDAAALKEAQGYLDQALALAPERAQTIMLLGHLAYLRGDFSRSIELLRQARSRGADSAWLAVNLGDAEWAMAYKPLGPDQDLMRQAAAEFEAALKQPLPEAARARALHQLTSIYAVIGDNHRAAALYPQYISLQHGNYDTALALHRYSVFQLLAARDVDGAVTSAAAAQKLEDNSVYRTWLAEALLARGDQRFSSGNKAESADDFAAARRLHVNLESLAEGMATFPGTLPGVFGLHEAGIVTDFSGSLGGNALVAASGYASKADIEKFLKWGANPNYFSADQGAPLHMAILGRNVEAVKVLLAHGADATMPSVDGRTPMQMGTDVKQPEIIGLIEQAGGGRTAPLPLPDPPFTVNHRYRLKKPLESDERGDHIPANWEFVYLYVCKEKGNDPTLACYVGEEIRAIHGILHAFSLDRAQIRDWKDWFEDLGPVEKPGEQ